MAVAFLCSFLFIYYYYVLYHKRVHWTTNVNALIDGSDPGYVIHTVPLQWSFAYGAHHYTNAFI